MAIDLPKLLFGAADHIYKLLEKIPKTKVENQEVTINVPEAVVDYAMAVRIPKNFRSIRKNIKIDVPSVTRASAMALTPIPKSIRGAFKKNPADECYVLDRKLVPSDCDLIYLCISYKIEDLSVIDDLVQRTEAHEPGGDENNEYWMSAQLKHPKILADNFGKFDLRDVDITVDVAVHNELKTTIPNPYIQRWRALHDVASEKDPRQQIKAIPRLRRTAKQKTVGREFDIFNELTALFLPGAFSKFVQVLEDFKYSSCYPGVEHYELPIEAIPKEMDVISRTSLTLEKPASNGTLIYKRNLLIETLNKIFSKH
jgi:hypothetical protein